VKSRRRVEVGAGEEVGEEMLGRVEGEMRGRSGEEVGEEMILEAGEVEEGEILAIIVSRVVTSRRIVRPRRISLGALSVGRMDILRRIAPIQTRIRSREVRALNVDKKGICRRIVRILGKEAPSQGQADALSVEKKDICQEIVLILDQEVVIESH
jgi:hypothetical protein